MRINKVDPADYNDKQKQLHERISGARGQVRGPFLVWMHRPEICDLVERLGRHIRRDSPLAGRIAELSLLIAARHWDSTYTWGNHSEYAVEAGVSQKAIDDLAAGRTPQFESEDEQVLYRFATELLENHFVSEETYAEAKRVFTEPGIVDLVAAIGTFSTLAMVLNTFEVDLNPGRPEPFPDIANYRRIAPKPKG